MKKWQPSKTARRAFAIKMQDPTERKAYEDRKNVKADKRRSSSKFDYISAGGSYLPTKMQADAAFEFLTSKIMTSEQTEACNAVFSAYGLNEKIAHDSIHVVNELIRAK